MTNESMLTRLTEEREMLSESLFLANKKSVILTDLIHLMSDAYALSSEVEKIEYEIRQGREVSKETVVKAAKLSFEVKAFVKETLRAGF